MEKIKFGQLFAFQKKTNLKASEEDIDGKFPFYTSSSVISKRTNNPIYNKISLIIGNGGSANIHYADVPFSATSHCYIAVANTSDVNTKFVYFYLSNNLHILERGFKGAGLKNISSKYVEEIEIPLPDLETQNKIVAILD
ncbi:MAG: restriction endonuclease subunit S, partial [Chryseotalea sp.]